MEYANTDAVPENGVYVCTSCGDTQEFEAGDDFVICENCGDESAGWGPQTPEAAEEGLGEEEERAGSGPPER
ncbi:MAG: hypothetical protein Q8R32_01110 [bacterium]|nr:hypothetical protein [bacterium]